MRQTPPQGCLLRPWRGRARRRCWRQRRHRTLEAATAPPPPAPCPSSAAWSPLPRSICAWPLTATRIRSRHDASAAVHIQHSGTTRVSDLPAPAAADLALADGCMNSGSASADYVIVWRWPATCPTPMQNYWQPLAKQTTAGMVAHAGMRLDCADIRPAVFDCHRCHTSRLEPLPESSRRASCPTII